MSEGHLYDSKMHQQVYLLLGLLQFISILEKDKIAKKEMAGIKGMCYWLRKPETQL